MVLRQIWLRADSVTRDPDKSKSQIWKSRVWLFADSGQCDPPLLPLKRHFRIIILISDMNRIRSIYRLYQNKIIVSRRVSFYAVLLATPWVRIRLENLVCVWTENPTERWERLVFFAPYRPALRPMLSKKKYSGDKSNFSFVYFNFFHYKSIWVSNSYCKK